MVFGAEVAEATALVQPPGALRLRTTGSIGHRDRRRSSTIAPGVSAPGGSRQHGVTAIIGHPKAKSPG